MSQVRMTAHFDAPIDRVFELGTDFKRFPEWNVSYNEVTEVTGPTDQVGTRIFAVMQILGGFIKGSAEIIEVDRPRMLKMIGSGDKGGALETVYRFTPTADGTDLTIDIDYELPAGVVGQIADKLFVEKSIERAVRHSLENFQAFVEAPVPVLA
jgi:uncharacterized membrane protein